MTAKYMRMLAVGVPRNGVEQKMRMDGVDEDTIQILLSSRQCLMGPPLSPPPPPPPPPVPVASMTSSGGAMAAVFQDIVKGNFNLKKNTKQIDTKKILKFVDTSKKVPSLEEIQVALKNLRKIK